MKPHRYDQDDLSNEEYIAANSIEFDRYANGVMQKILTRMPVSQAKLLTQACLAAPGEIRAWRNAASKFGKLNNRNYSVRLGKDGCYYLIRNW